MIRSTLAIASGFISMAALNGFLRLLIAVYHDGDLQSVSGVASLPSAGWGYFVTGIQYAWGIFAGLLTTSIAQQQAAIEILAIVLLLVGSGFIDYQMLRLREPVWYLTLSPSLKILGILSGYYLKQRHA